MKILLAVDGSSNSEAMVKEAAGRPWPLNSEFVLITALDPYFFTRAPLLLDEAKESIQREQEEQAKPLRDAGCVVETKVVLDNPRHAISRVAQEWRTDLILIGTRGRGAFSRLLLGSTAQAVLREAHCSVELVRAPRKDKTAAGMRVLIPTDGSDCARMAIDSVARRPWPEGAEFKIISCPEFPVIVGEYSYFTPERVTDLAKSSEAHARESAESGAEVLKKAGMRVTTEVTESKDSPARAILDVAERWQADLVVMGSHGRRGFDRLVLGSVSESVALHANCSVEVTRQTSN